MEQNNNAPDLADIQGLIITGYTHPFSCHMVFQFGATDKIASFMKAIYPYVRPATIWFVKPNNMLNIGLTWTGINKINSKLDPSKFDPEFVIGSAGDNPQQSLCDIGPSDPSNWVFGNNTIPVDCLVHIYGLTNDYLQTLVTIVSDAANAAGFTEIFPISNKQRLEQYQLEPNHIHFGYHDGISEPDLNKSLEPLPQETYTDPANLNNFLLNYGPNVSAFFPLPAGASTEAKFAANGCYNAFRMLEQDSEKFETFLSENAEVIAPQIKKDLEYSKEWLAAKVIGRWRNGSPLILSPDMPDHATAKATKFEFNGDPMGFKCPISAHTRVANPRDTVMLPQDAPIPRILRRGVPYGAPHTVESGLIGLFLCGSFANQFEMVSGWINRNNFTPPLSGEYPMPQDAILANRQVSGTTNTFEIPISPDGKSTITPPPTLTQFIITKGSAYCLLPSLSTLRSCFE